MHRLFAAVLVCAALFLAAPAYAQCSLASFQGTAWGFQLHGTTPAGGGMAAQGTFMVGVGISRGATPTTQGIATGVVTIATAGVTTTVTPALSGIFQVETPTAPPFACAGTLSLGQASGLQVLRFVLVNGGNAPMLYLVGTDNSGVVVVGEARPLFAFAPPA